MKLLVPLRIWLLDFGQGVLVVTALQVSFGNIYLADMKHLKMGLSQHACIVRFNSSRCRELDPACITRFQLRLDLPCAD